MYVKYSNYSPYDNQSHVIKDKIRNQSFCGILPRIIKKEVNQLPLILNSSFDMQIRNLHNYKREKSLGDDRRRVKGLHTLKKFVAKRKNTMMDSDSKNCSYGIKMEVSDENPRENRGHSFSLFALLQRCPLPELKKRKRITSVAY